MKIENIWTFFDFQKWLHILHYCSHSCQNHISRLIWKITKIKNYSKTAKRVRNHLFFKFEEKKIFTLFSNCVVMKQNSYSIMKIMLLCCFISRVLYSTTINTMQCHQTLRSVTQGLHCFFCVYFSLRMIVHWWVNVILAQIYIFPTPSVI